MDYSFQSKEKYLRKVKYLSFFLIAPMTYTYGAYNKYDYFTLSVFILINWLFFFEIFGMINIVFFEGYIKKWDNGKEVTNSLLSKLMRVICFLLIVFSFCIGVIENYDIKFYGTIYGFIICYKSLLDKCVVVSDRYLVYRFSIYNLQAIEYFEVKDYKMLNINLVGGKKLYIKGKEKMLDELCDLLRVRTYNLNEEIIHKTFWINLKNFIIINLVFIIFWLVFTDGIVEKIFEPTSNDIGVCFFLSLLIGIILFDVLRNITLKFYAVGIEKSQSEIYEKLSSGILIKIVFLAAVVLHGLFYVLNSHNIIYLALSFLLVFSYSVACKIKVNKFFKNDFYKFYNYTSAE